MEGLALMYPNVLRWFTRQIGVVTLPDCHHIHSPLLALTSVSKLPMLKYDLNPPVSRLG